MKLSRKHRKFSVEPRQNPLSRSRRNELSLVLMLFGHDRAVVLVLFQNKMSCRADDSIQSGELVGHKSGDLFQSLSFKDNHQVITSRDQIGAVHFRPSEASHGLRSGL